MGTLRLVKSDKNIIQKENFGPIFLYKFKNSKQNMSKSNQAVSKESNRPRQSEIYYKNTSLV